LTLGEVWGGGKKARVTAAVGKAKKERSKSPLMFWQRKGIEESGQKRRLQIFGKRVIREGDEERVLVKEPIQGITGREGESRGGMGKRWKKKYKAKFFKND